MPERASQVPYTPYPTESVSGAAGGPMSVRSTPNDFGAQVSEAQIKVGQEGFDLAQKQQNMINETNMFNADNTLSGKLGALHGQFMSLTGEQAYGQKDAYLAAAKSAVDETRGSLKGQEAIHGYDMMAARRLSNVTESWEGHAATQVKAANEQAHLDGLNVANLRAQDPTLDDHAFAEQVTGPIKFHAGAALDENQPGFKTDPETGKVNFSDDPAGQNAKAAFQNNLDYYLGQAYEKRFDTLSDTLGPTAAYQKFQQDKDKIPQNAVAAIEAGFAPKIFNQNVSAVTNYTITEAKQAYQQTLVNPSSAGSNAYNLGNVKTAQGAANNTQDFVNPSTPVDGVILTANNLRSKNYAGKTLAEIGKTWTSTDKDAWVKNVSSVSGISPDTIPNLDDPKQLVAMMRGIAAAEKSPADRAHFTDDVISQGVTASLNGQKPNTAQAKPYATNDLGGKLSDADYYATHRAEIVQKARDWAHKQDPGNLRLENAAVERVNQQMEYAIRDQNAQLSQSKNIIQQGANGKFTQGRLPTSEELYAIPEVKQAIDTVSVHDSTDFMRRLDERLAARGTDKEAKTYGSGFMDGMKGIHPTDGSAPTITNGNQLFDMYYSGKITDAGREKLQKELDGRSTPEGESEGIMKRQFLANAKAELTGTNEGLGIKDHKGEQIYLHFISQALPAYDKGRSEGKSPAQLLNPDSADYVGKAIPTFKRLPAVWANDMMSDNSEGSGGNTARSLATIIQDVHNGKLTQEQGKKEALSLGLIRAEAEGGPQVPRPE